MDPAGALHGVFMHLAHVYAGSAVPSPDEGADGIFEGNGEGAAGALVDTFKIDCMQGQISLHSLHACSWCR